MGIKRPDEYEHANPAEPIVRSSNVKGGALKTADLDTLLTDFTGLESKLIEGVTKVYVVSEDADYRLMNIAALDLLASWNKVVTGGVGGASSFSELEGAPSDNEALGADLLRIEDKADGAQADFDYLATVVDGKLTGTKASDAELQTQTTPTEDNKFVSRRGLIYWWNWLRSQAVTITGNWNFTGTLKRGGSDVLTQVDATVALSEYFLTAKNTGLAKDFEAVDLYLGTVDDSGGLKTSTELNSSFPTAVLNQRVYGGDGVYEKKTSSVWFYFEINIV